MTSIETILNSKCGPRNQHLREPVKKKKRNKYNNKKKEVDGILFDSEKEAEYYGKLKILLKAGEIGLLERQVPYELNPGGSYSYKYIADFVFIDAKTGEKNVIDVKGYRTKEYVRKRRLMKKIHKIIITEI